MAIGKASDFKVYDEYFHTRVNELLAQNGNAFNGASNGSIRLGTQSILGNYKYSSLFQAVGSSLVARRDTTSVTGQSDTALTQIDDISVKLNRKMIPITQTRDAFRKIFGSFDAATFTGIVAEQFANAMQLEMLNTALGACAQAVKNEATGYFTNSSLGSMDTNTLVDTLAKFGDRADRVVAWVMHSKVYYNLVKSQINANITGVSNLNVAQATPVTLNRPVIVSDSSSLIINPTSPDVNNYLTLGLTQDAIDIVNSETQDVVVQDVTGLENLAVRIQGEYAYNLGLKGFQWDVSNGGANPTTAAVLTGTNWDKTRTDVKDRAGVACLTL